MNFSIPCPHCNQPIKTGLLKGLGKLKFCPNCNKAIKYKKPEEKKLLLGFIGWLVIMLPILIVFIKLFGINSSAVIFIVILSYLPLFMYVIKNSHFEKEE